MLKDFKSFIKLIKTISDWAKPLDFSFTLVKEF